jgi:hypothetical protein
MAETYNAEVDLGKVQVADTHNPLAALEVGQEGPTVIEVEVLDSPAGHNHQTWMDLSNESHYL